MVNIVKTKRATRTKKGKSVAGVQGLASLLALLSIVALQQELGISSVGMASPVAEHLDNLTKEKVIPDVIDAEPKHAIKIEYGAGVEVHMGNELKPTQVKDLPKINFDDVAKPDKLYTLAMVDPDAPSRAEPKLREILHFMVANIPGKDLAKGDTFAEYIGSGPPSGSGLHRYIFLLFEQKEKLKKDLMSINKSTRTGRPNFSIRKFAKEHQLGEPLAANFYQAQYDDYVPKLHAQLTN